MRIIHTKLLNFSHSVRLLTNTQVRNFVRLLRNEHVTKLNEETLTGRILNYLKIDKENHVNLTITQQNGTNLSNFNENILAKYTIDELIHSISLLKNCPNLQESSKMIQRFDMESTLRLDNLDNETIFRILSVFMQILPNRITELQFYQSAIKELSKSINELNKNELLPLIFYIGLKKRTPESRNLLRKCMKSFNKDFINNLTIEELCIICNSNFKTSTRIENQLFLDKVRDCLNDHLSLLKDPQLFITLIKTIRHNRYQDANLLSTIVCGVFFNKTLEFYNFSALCHILALFADYNYYDANILKSFTQKCLDELKHSSFISKFTHLTQQLRGKDIKRFLWCLSNFSSHKLLENDDFEQIIIPKIIERVEMGEFDDVDSLVDIALYLWMLNYRPYQLVPYVLTEKNLQILQGKKTKSKERLNLLLYCIFIEDRQLFNKLDLKPTVPQHLLPIEYHLNRRPLLKRVMDNLKLLSKQCDLNRFEFTYEIPYINIIGITGYTKKIYKTVFIEILDDRTCLRNANDEDGDNVPIGLMDLKLRLLDQSDEAVIVVSRQEIESLTESQLQELLFDEIKLVCNV